MSVFAKEGFDSKRKILIQDDVTVVREIKREKRLTNKLPHRLTCTLCSGLLKEPVQLPCCKTALCKLCAFQKLEQHNRCWFEFCPESAEISKDAMKVSLKLIHQVNLWKIQRKGKFLESNAVGEVKTEKNFDLSSAAGEVNNNNVDASIKVAQVKIEKNADAKFNSVVKREYIENDVELQRKEGIRYEVKQGKIFRVATGASSRDFDPKVPSSSAEAFQVAPVSAPISEVIKSEKGLEENWEKYFQSNYDCLEVKNYQSKLTLPTKMDKQLLTNEDCLKIPVIDIVDEEETMASKSRMTKWVNVCGYEGEEPIKIATENDGTLLLSSVKSQFPETTGLKYKNTETNSFCGVRCHQKILFAPRHEGWSDLTFVCVRHTASKQCKRKVEIGQASEIQDDKNQSTKAIKIAENSIRSRPFDWDPNCKIYISGQLKDVRKYDLEDAFKKYGNVKNVWISRRPSVFAFVEMSNARDAEDAVRGLNGARICGGRVKVEMGKGGKGEGGGGGREMGRNRRRSRSRSLERRKSRSRSPRKSRRSSSYNSMDSNDDGNKSKIFVGIGLNKNITVEDLKDHFETFGRVTNVYIVNRRKCYAFVQFRDPKVANALQDMGDHVIKGVTVVIRKPSRFGNKVEWK